MENTERPLFRDLNADDPNPEITEIESYCMNCEKNVSFLKECPCNIEFI